MKLEVVELKPVAPPKEYALTLSQSELDVIVAAIGGIGGYDGNNGWKSIINQLYRELSSSIVVPSHDFIAYGEIMKHPLKNPTK